MLVIIYIQHNVDVKDVKTRTQESRKIFLVINLALIQTNIFIIKEVKHIFEL